MGAAMTQTDYAKLRHPKAGAPTVQHPYHNIGGEVVLIANRYERGDGSKFFIPYDVTAQSWTAPDNRPLYRLPELLAANSDRVVIVTEGEKCADALAGLGYAATTSFGGANAARKTDLSPLAGRKVIIWPDHDAPGQKYAEQISVTLHRDFETPAQVLPISEETLCKVTGRAIADADGNPCSLPKGWDAADAVAEGWTITDINSLISLTVAANVNATPDASAAPNESEGENDAPLFADADLWHGTDKTPYITLQRKTHRETYTVGSAAFKALLAYEHYLTKGKTPSAAKLDDLTRQYYGQALFEGETHPVFLRLGEAEDGFALDLGGADWSVIEINAEGWQERPMGSPRFRRSAGMSALPRPTQKDSDLNQLRQFVNVKTDDDFKLIVGWLLGALRPNGPYPLLILTGEQGSAKSTTAKALRRLIDPAEMDSRSFPGDERDLMISAQNGHVLAFDNLSRIKPAMADALCRLATGGGFATRKLHSDADEVLFKATRPIILNGIPELAERPDLADRAISLNLPVISETRREYEAEFWQRFDAARPAILGALLTAVSGALAALPSVRLSERPRMADFAKWVTAAEGTLGWPQGAFLSAYSANIKESADEALESNAVASTILSMVQANGNWQGTAAELILALRRLYPTQTEGADTFPRQPAAFGAELRRVAPLLRSSGVSVVHNRVGKERRRVIELKQD